MVARTPPLGSLKKGFKKSILPQIHQPLPLNKRESQQLLNSITSSFRKNLDQEHPWQPHETTDATAAKAGTYSSLQLVEETPSKNRPTDRHLGSILTNPLFAQPTVVNRQAPNGLQYHHDVFDSAVSRGMMSVRRAAGYLAMVNKQIQSSALQDRVALASSGAGLRVVQWLRSSGAESSLEFLSDKYLMPLLVQFMFFEGLEEVAWTWLSRLGARLHALPKDGQTQHSIACLLQVIHLAQTTKVQGIHAPQSSLDPSYSSFLRANRTLGTEDPVAVKSLQRYWASLSWSSTVLASQHQSPSAPLYEMFTNVGRSWKKHLDIAHLELHHPFKPDHSSAVKYLHDERVQDAANSMKKYEKYVERMVSLGSDTVNRLQQVGEQQEASWVSEFMARTFFAWNLQPGRSSSIRLS